MIKAAHSVSNLSSNSESSPYLVKRSQNSHFVQVLDESMCVVREDLTEWLQHYLFSTANACPIAAHFLLYRLASGLWLSRLAYKLHYSILESGFKTAVKSKTIIKKDKEIVSYEFLRGALSNRDLKNLSPLSLPSFPQTLTICAKLPLGPTDLCSFSSLQNTCRNNSSPKNCDVDFPKENISLKPRVADRWIARDNISAFIKWCKELGVPETLLFETNGLMNRTEEKNVLLTLMEVARIASRYGLTDLPYLVRMEREIDEIEAKRAQDENYKDNTYHEDAHHFTSQAVINLERIDHEDNYNSSVEVTVGTSGKKIQKLNSDTKSIDVHLNVNANSVDTSLVDSCCDDSRFINTNNNKTVQIHVDRKNVSSDSTTLNYYNHDDSMDNTYKSTLVTNMNSGYNNHMDDSKTVTAQFDYINNDHHKSTCNDMSVQTKDDNLDQAKRLPVLNGSLLSLDDSDDSPRKAITDQFVQQQHTDHLKMTDSPFCNIANRKRRQTLLINDLGLQIPIVEITPLKITKKVDESSSFMNSKTVCCNDVKPEIDPPEKFITYENLVDSKISDTCLKSLQVESAKLVQEEVQQQVCIQDTSTILNVSVMDYLVYSEKCTENLSTDMSSIADECIIDIQVNKKLAQCTCCNRLHMQRLEEGRYRLGTRIYYLRRFRNHVMVRVGGGWLTLDEFLQRHDPCRRGITPCCTETSAVPHIKACLEVTKPIRRYSDFDTSIPRINSVSNLMRQSSNRSSNGSVESPRSESSTVSSTLDNGIPNNENLPPLSSTMVNGTKSKQVKAIVTPRSTVPKAPTLRTASRTRESSRSRDDSTTKSPQTATVSNSRALSTKRTNPTQVSRDSRVASHSRNPSARRDGSSSRVLDLTTASRSRDSSAKREKCTSNNSRSQSISNRTPWRN
ncbi:unnamed protein product [Trichobilharzia szidati]|nr:unnamed protein product [Trichobilharzia szidati]